MTGSIAWQINEILSEYGIIGQVFIDMTGFYMYEIVVKVADAEEASSLTSLEGEGLTLEGQAQGAAADIKALLERV